MTEFFRRHRVVLGADAAAERLSEVYGRVSVQSDHLNLAESSLGDDAFRLATTEYDGAMDVVVEPDHFAVNVGGPDGLWWATADDSGTLAEGPVLFQPEVALTAHVGDLRNENLLLDRERLQAYAAAAYADDRIAVHFAGERAVDARAAATWTATYRLAASLGHELDAELVRAAVYRLLAATTLETFRLVGEATDRHETVRALLAAYRRAVAFIDANAARPITVEDVARAAEVGLLDLGLAFRANSPVDATPQEYLLRARLSGAHLDLVCADPTRGDTVRAVGLRWGFLDPRGFARRYRAAYGVNPSATLRG